MSRSAAMPPTGSASANTSSAALERAHRQHRRRAADEAGDAGRRPVGRRELERRRMAEPARERLAQAARGPCARCGADGPRRRPARPGRRSGTCSRSRPRSRRRRACRSTGTAPAECARSQTVSAPAACAARVSLGHVVHAAAAVVDVRQHQHRDVVGRGVVEVGGLDQAQLQAGGAATLSAMYRSVGKLPRSERMRARRRVGRCSATRGAQRLEQVDRGRVADADLARPRRRSARRSCRRCAARDRSSRRCSSCGSGLRPIRASIVCGSRAAVRRGSAPSELPSR